MFPFIWNMTRCHRMEISAQMYYLLFFSRGYTLRVMMEWIYCTVIFFCTLYNYGYNIDLLICRCSNMLLLYYYSSSAHLNRFLFVWIIDPLMAHSDKPILRVTSQNSVKSQISMELTHLLNRFFWQIHLSMSIIEGMSIIDQIIARG